MTAIPNIRFAPEAVPMKYEIKHRKSVLWAMDEYDRLGKAQFLQKYGFGAAHKFAVVNPNDKSKRYDPKAIAAAAIGLEQGKWPKAQGAGFKGGAMMKRVFDAVGLEVIELKGGRSTRLPCQRRTGDSRSD